MQCLAGEPDDHFADPAAAGAAGAAAQTLSGEGAVPGLDGAACPAADTGAAFPAGGAGAGCAAPDKGFQCFGTGSGGTGCV